jgi:hypothetical protein
MPLVGIQTATERSRKLVPMQLLLPACQFMPVPELHKEVHKSLLTMEWHKTQDHGMLQKLWCYSVLRSVTKSYGAKNWNKMSSKNLPFPML